MKELKKKAALSVLDEIIGKCDDSAASRFKKAPKEELKSEEKSKEDVAPSPKEDEDDGETKPKLEDADLEDLLEMYKKLK